MAIRRWTLLTESAPCPGWHNMALDQALLDHAERTGEGHVRLYRWSPPCLSFGRHEPALRRYDRAGIEALGLATVRRPTGGRAVWHAEELTYAVAAPADWFGTLRQAYQAIHAALAAALAGLGVAAALAPPRGATPLGAGACFAAPAGGEVVVAAGKLVGSAQLRQGNSFLQHGSILLDGDQSLIARVTRGAAPEDRAVTLAMLLGRCPSPAEVAAAVIGAIRVWPGAWQEAPPDRGLLAAAAAHAPRFRDPDWTWAR